MPTWRYTEQKTFTKTFIQILSNIRIPYVAGRGNYCSEINEVSEESDKHLYHCSVLENVFVGEEILGFSQSSLLPEANWLLDAGNVIWVWMGALAEIRNLKKCVENASIYLYTHPAGRDRNTTISIIKQGQEPPTFIGLFDNWNHNNLRNYRSFDDIRISIEGNRQCKHNRNENPASEFDGYVKYPLRILKSDAEHLPSDVDVFKKEMHLTYDDFTSIFKMNPVEFEKLPAWRRQRLKQTAGIF